MLCGYFDKRESQQFVMTLLNKKNISLYMHSSIAIASFNHSAHDADLINDSFISHCLNLSLKFNAGWYIVYTLAAFHAYLFSSLRILTSSYRIAQITNMIHKKREWWKVDGIQLLSMNYYQFFFIYIRMSLRKL